MAKQPKPPAKPASPAAGDITRERFVRLYRMVKLLAGGEWRVIGDVEFELDDLVCVILPEYETDLRKQMAAKGIAAVDPDWSHEQVISELASQQRRTKQIWKDRLPKAKPKLKLANTGT